MLFTRQRTHMVLFRTLNLYIFQNESCQEPVMTMSTLGSTALRVRSAW